MRMGAEEETRLLRDVIGSELSKVDRVGHINEGEVDTLCTDLLDRAVGVWQSVSRQVLDSSTALP